MPTLVATLCICIVWLPLFQLSGIAGYLFLPMAEAIIFAMIASFILSRTLGSDNGGLPAARAGGTARRRPGAQPTVPSADFQRGFERRFQRFRKSLSGHSSAGSLGTEAIRHWLPGRFGGLTSVSSHLPRAGLLPGIKSGEIDMHMRAPNLGTRLEEAFEDAVLVNQSVRNILARTGPAMSSITVACRSAKSTAGIERHRDDRTTGLRHYHQSEKR